MNQLKKALIFLAFIGILTFPATASAKDFIIHLYYDQNSKAIKFDNLFPEHISLDKKLSASQIDFLNGAANQPGADYIALLNDTNGAEIGRMEFKAQNGPFAVNIPFFPFSGSLKILDKASGKEILSSDLSRFLNCNANHICELEQGENVEDCLVDCGTSHNAYSDETKKILRDNNGTVKDPDTGDIKLKDPVYSLNPSPSQNNASQNIPAASSGSFPTVLIFLSTILIITIGAVVYFKYIKK